nr:HepT-like ribonuclease domain-containing protein [uncultured Rhodopila sp.]
MARGDKEWVADIIAGIADIRADTAGMDFSAFTAKPAIVRSVLYSIAVMGEAAKKISPEFKAAHPDVPWRAIAGTRDRIVHEYFRTNTRRIRDVVVDDIDALEEAVRKPPALPSSGP